MRQLLTTFCRTPNASANLPTPPAYSIAAVNASIGGLSPTVLDVSTAAVLASLRASWRNWGMDFPANLRRLRKAAKLTQQQLADACEFSTQSRIGNYEAGRGLPSLPDLLVMARVLHVGIGEFFGEPSRAVRHDPEMVDDVIFALNAATGTFDEASARDFVRLYEIRARTPERPTKRDMLAIYASVESGVGSGRNSPLHPAGGTKAGRKRSQAR